MNPQNQVLANGNIAPATFIKLDSTADHAVIQAGAATDIPFGISIDASAAAPQAGASTLASTAGNPLRYFAPGDEATLVLGTGGCAAGDLLVSDASGNGVTAGAVSSSSLQWIGAQALEAGNAGEKVRVRVMQVPYGA